MSKGRAENEKLVLQWLATVADALSAPTYDDYSRVAWRWVKYLGDESIIDICLKQPASRSDVPPAVDVVRGFLFRPRERGGKNKNQPLSPSTIRHDKAVLNSFFGWANAMGIIVFNPMHRSLIKTPKVPRGKPKPIADTIWLVLWNDPKLTLPERVCFALEFYCGMRSSDVRRLEPSMWDGERFGGWWRKNGDEGLNDVWANLQAFEALLPHLIPEGASAVLAMIDRYVKAREGHDYVLPWGESDRRNFREESADRVRYGVPKSGASSRQVYRRFVKIMRRNGIYERGITTPHKLRHACGTNMKRMGFEDSEVETVLGHRDPEMLSNYAEIAGDTFRAKVARLQHERAQRHQERPRLRAVGEDE